MPFPGVQEVDTSILGISKDEAAKFPYIASMGIYVFKKDILLKLLRWRFPTSNDFGGEIIPASASEYNVQVGSQCPCKIPKQLLLGLRMLDVMGLMMKDRVCSFVINQVKIFIVRLLIRLRLCRRTCLMTTGKTLAPSSRSSRPI